MRILLITPRFPTSLWDFSHCRGLMGGRYPHPPLALPTLAGLTPAGHVVQLVDENVERLPDAIRADLVGISAYSVQASAAFRLAAELRARGALVALGGPLVAESTVEECARHVDHVFLGEAERTWPAFLGDLEQGTARRIYRESEAVELSLYPAPRFDLLRAERYTTGTVETSRGCPYQCEFCEIPVRLGARSRSKTTAQIVAEVRQWRRVGADSVFFIDDHFVGHRRRTLDLLRALIGVRPELGSGFSFSCQISLDLASDDELLATMREAGFNRVFVGIESTKAGNRAHFRKLGRGTLDPVEAVHRLQRHGLIVWASLMVGLDEDDSEVFHEIPRFLEEAGIPVAMVGLIQALPGTPLHERLAREGRLKARSAGGIRTSAQEMLETNVRPRNMTEAELTEGFRRLAGELYAAPAFRRRLKVSLAALPRSARGNNGRLGSSGRRGFGPHLRELLAGKSRRPGARASVIPKGYPEVERHAGLSRGEQIRVLLRFVWYLVGSAPKEERLLAWSVFVDQAAFRFAHLEPAFQHLILFAHLRRYYGELSAPP